MSKVNKKEQEKKIEKEIFDKLREELMKEYESITWKKWQNDILNLADKEPDNFVHWYYDKKGNSGKSYLCKYIACAKDNMIVSNGEKKILVKQIDEFIKNKINPRLIIIDVPRGQMNKINYDLLNDIKNGLIYSTGYKNSNVIFDKVNLVVLTHTEPNKDVINEDKYKIYNIDNF